MELGCHTCMDVMDGNYVVYAVYVTCAVYVAYVVDLVKAQG